MQLRLPRRPRTHAAHQTAPDAERLTLPADDPWAGEDAAWTSDEDLAREAPDDFIRFFRGAVVGVGLGLALWAAIALVALLLFG
jgi:hypothetical protein